MENKLNCIIIDDEPLARELLKKYIEKTPSLSLSGCFDSAAEAIKSVVEGEVDIIFLDINMPMLNGIDFATLVPPSIRIIFVTAYDRYALEGFKVNALDYLLKPVSYPDFLKSVGRALEWKAMTAALARSRTPEPAFSASPRLLTIKTEGRLMQLRQESILYIEVRNDRIILFRKEGEPITSLMTLHEIEDLLPRETFMRVHRSFIVNIPEIEIIERNRIIFGSTYIPIAESKREEFFARIGK